MPQHGSVAQQGILLGPRAAKTASAACGDDQGGASGHEVLDNIGLGGAHFALLHVLSGPAIARAQLLCTAQLAYNLIKQAWLVPRVSVLSISAPSASKIQ